MKFLLASVFELNETSWIIYTCSFWHWTDFMIKAHSYPDHQCLIINFNNISNNKAFNDKTVADKKLLMC